MKRKISVVINVISYKRLLEPNVTKLIRTRRQLATDCLSVQVKHLAWVLLNQVNGSFAMRGKGSKKVGNVIPIRSVNSLTEQETEH